MPLIFFNIYFCFHKQIATTFNNVDKLIRRCVRNIHICLLLVWNGGQFYAIL